MLDISQADIERVVPPFYERVRRDADLGPVFAAHVGNWPAHHDLIARFWRRVLCGEAVYSGSPPRAHRAVSELRPLHFVKWLSLFRETLREELPESRARQWDAHVHRMAQGLASGLFIDRPEHHAELVEALEVIRSCTWDGGCSCGGHTSA